jgi:hypothetical protein
MTDTSFMPVAPPSLPSPSSSGRSDEVGGEDRVERSSAPVSEETLEWIIERVERHVIEELERRGLRHNPGVF